MKPSQPLARSHLYTIRLWQEELGNDAWEWRGIVKYVASGEEHYFRDWGALKELMVRMTATPREDKQIAWRAVNKQPVR